MELIFKSILNVFTSRRYAQTSLAHRSVPLWAPSVDVNTFQKLFESQCPKLFTAALGE